MIRIITTKKYRQMKSEIDSLRAETDGLRGSILHMQELLKGHYNKYQYETGQYEQEKNRLRTEIESLKKDLRKAEHDKAEALKKLRKYEAKEKEKIDRSQS